jgi:hypothetical protein
MVDRGMGDLDHAGLIRLFDGSPRRHEDTKKQG